MKRPRNVSARKLAPWIVGGVLVVVGAGALVSSSHSSVTRARLERDLPQTFANRYVAQSRLLGHSGVSVRSMHPRAQCYKGVPDVADRGSGAGVWLCYLTWHDPNVDETLMPGKFELNVHSNSCYSATAPSRLVGLLTITDKNGKQVTNPVSEFDSCFDPHGDNRPTGNVDLVPTTTAPTGPSAVAIATSRLRPDRHGVIHIALTCAPGQEGCGGTISGTLAGRNTQSVAYALAPDSKGSLPLQLDPQQQTAGGTLVLTVTPVIGDPTVRKVSVPIRGT